MFGKKEMRILMVGLDAAGKVSIFESKRPSQSTAAVLRSWERSKIYVW